MTGRAPELQAKVQEGRGNARISTKRQPMGIKHPRHLAGEEFPLSSRTCQDQGQVLCGAEGAFSQGGQTPLPPTPLLRRLGPGTKRVRFPVKGESPDS